MSWVTGLNLGRGFIGDKVLSMLRAFRRQAGSRYAVGCKSVTITFRKYIVCPNRPSHTMELWELVSPLMELLIGLISPPGPFKLQPISASHMHDVRFVMILAVIKNILTAKKLSSFN